MFDIGWGELLVIGIVALIAIGPKELPGVLRATGVWMGKVRRMANEFQDQFREAMREAELADLKKQVDEMASSTESFTNIDPLGTARSEIEKAAGELPDLDAKPSETGSKPAENAASPPETPPAEQRKAGETA